MEAGTVVKQLRRRGRRRRIKVVVRERSDRIDFIEEECCLGDVPFGRGDEAVYAGTKKISRSGRTLPYHT